MAYDDPTNGGAGHHNVVFATRQLQQLLLDARMDELGGVIEHHDSISVPWEVGTEPYIKGRLTRLEKEKEEV
ncbi:MAG: hypothetical protein EPO02_13455 [Nitrospirae bacterium]|nr:MAG: hypothetical protein EPO02_13455 [Nitrospirota bacterium]